MPTERHARLDRVSLTEIAGQAGNDENQAGNDENQAGNDEKKLLKKRNEIIV